MRRLIIGCGYLGMRSAEWWLSRGDEVLALTRSSRRAGELGRAGIHPLVGDVLEPETLRDLPAAETVLYAVGFDRSSGATKQQVYVQGLRNVLESLPQEVGRLIYISSTSVYGQSAGEWVFEESKCEPTSPGGLICLEAERLLPHFRHKFRDVSTLRLSGIYGPGRLAARVEGLRERKAVAANPDGWVNLIHVDDACAAVSAVAEMTAPPEKLLVSDDEPLVRREYYGLLTEAIGAPEAHFHPPALTDLGKRCSNRRLREDLGFRLSYPTIREGLASAIPPWLKPPGSQP